MKKKQKNAQPVTEEKPTKLSEPERVDVPEQLNALTPTIAPPELTVEDRLARIEALVVEHEKNFQQVGTAFQQLQPLIDLSQKIAEQQKQAAENPQPQSQGGALAGAGQLLPMLMQVFGGGGGGSALGDELTKKVIEAGMSQMFAGTELLKAMQAKFLSEWGANTVKTSLEKSQSS